MHFSRLLLLSTLALVGSCSAPAPPLGQVQSDIIGGTDDTGDPSVVLLVGTVPGATTSSLCTSEVVSPHAVLTAAHCVDPAMVGAGAQFFLFLGDNINDTTEANTQSNYINVSNTVFISTYDNTAQVDLYDVGIASTLVPIGRPVLPINMAAITQADVGHNIRVVGYGVDAASDTKGTSAGIKREITTPITDYDDGFIYLGNASQLTCHGDSGGPAFLSVNGTEVIAGIAATSDCVMSSQDTRPDVYYNSFIEPQIEAAETAAANADLSQAPMDMAVAQPDLAVGPDLAGGAFGASCVAGGDCISGECKTGKNGYCTQACEPTDTSSCPGGFHCAKLSGANYCEFTSHGGCSTAAATPGQSRQRDLVPVLLMLIGLIEFHRRRAIRYSHAHEKAGVGDRTGAGRAVLGRVRRH